MKCSPSFKKGEITIGLGLPPKTRTRECNLPKLTIWKPSGGIEDVIMFWGRQCLSWVNCVGFAGPRRLPVYPGERTFSGSAGMSQRCQQRKSPLFDHLVANGRAWLRWFIRAAPLVFVRLAHDRRFVGAFLFLFVLFFLFFFSSSSFSSGSRGGIVLPMITKGLLSINLVENSSRMCGVMLLLRLLPQVVSTLAYLLLFHLRH